MAEFLELLESIRVEDASTDRLFGDTREDISRSYRSNRARDPKYRASLAEAATFTAEVMEGRRPIHHLKEAMSRSDFPLLFGDILDRTLLAAYQAWPLTWPAIAARRTAPDFRTLQRFYVDGGDDGLFEVKELTEYSETAMREGKYQVSIKKYGRRIGFSWETLINDDIDFIRTAPQALARGARRTEHRFVSDMYVGPNGPDAALYTAPNGNIVTGNPVLSVDGLNTAFTMLGNMTYQGEPIIVEAVRLVVPPALEVRAQTILNSATIEVSGATVGANMTMVASNWMRNRVQLSVDPYIPILATSANGATSWFLFADANNGRPALEVDFLRGHEAPELFQKSPNALRLGGGPADPMDGSYENDSIDYKVRHVFGGGIVDPKMTVASNGSGT